MPSTRALVASLAFAAGLVGCIRKSGEVSEPAVLDFDDEDHVDQPPPRKARADAGRDDGEVPGVDATAPREPRFDPHAVRPRLPTPPPSRLSLITAERPPPPLSGGTLTVSSDGAIAVAADPDRDAVYVVSTERGTVENIELPARSEPGRVILDGSGGAHVILRGAGSVLRIALDEPDGAKRTEVCQHPRGIAYQAASDSIWIACAGGELVSMAAKTHAVTTRSFVALDLRDVIVSADGEILVSRYRSAELLGIGEDGNVASAAQPKKEFGRKSRHTMSPTLAWRTIAGSDGLPIMLHSSAQDSAIVISTPGGSNTQGDYGGGHCASFNVVQSSITRFDEQGAALETTLFPGSGLSVDVAASPDGKMLAIASPGAYMQRRGTLTLLPMDLLFASQPLVDAGAPLERDDIDAGVVTTRHDAGFAISRFDTGTAMLQLSGCFNPFALFSAEKQTTAVAFDASGRLYALSREPAELFIIEPNPHFSGGLGPGQTIALSDRSVRDTGHDLFHTDVSSGMSCASCHGEALDDGHVWHFQDIGPRRTQNMRGGLSSTLPLHWEGDMMTFKHLVDEVMTRRMGGFQVQQEYADALATWIDAQPELTLAGGDAAAIARGKALFDSAEVGCATCHAGPQLTNNSTGGRFQVSSLLGLGLRGPYMHDGCAKTLRDRFSLSCGGGDQHGKTSGLSESQIADLVAYLTVL